MSAPGYRQFVRVIWRVILLMCFARWLADGQNEVMLQSRSNNFDFVRLLAAGIVLCGHQFAVCLRPEPLSFGLITLGTLGVLIFFSISGYLVAQSWDRDPHVLRFTIKRFLRIWPGLAVVTFVAAFIVGPAVTSLSLRDYFSSSITWDYFSQFYLNIEYALPGVFERNPISAVNSSLWTIPIEVSWYGIFWRQEFSDY